MRQKRICRALLWVLFAVGSYQLLVAHFLAGLVPDIEIDPETGRKRVRRRPERNKKLDANGKVIPRYVCVCIWLYVSSWFVRTGRKPAYFPCARACAIVEFIIASQSLTTFNQGLPSLTDSRSSPYPAISYAVTLKRHTTN